MKILNIVIGILVVLIGFIIIFLIATAPERRYEAFLNCTKMNTTAVCAQLFGK